MCILGIDTVLGLHEEFVEDPWLPRPISTGPPMYNLDGRHAPIGVIRRTPRSTRPDRSTGGTETWSYTACCRGGRIVFDDSTDMVGLAHGVARFLAVDSCGQCTPCKQDGLALRDLFDRLRRSEAEPDVLDEIDDHLRTVAGSARCFLATQQQVVLGSIRPYVDEGVHSHVGELIAPIVDIVDGVARLDESQRAKQPDWTYDPIDSGKAPAARLGGPHAAAHDLLVPRVDHP